jgi:YesN/AraC family two-component response regulator
VIIDLLISILEDGHTVDTASNRLEAYAKIRAQSYELIITDIRMPQMNGMDLTAGCSTVSRT